MSKEDQLLKDGEKVEKLLHGKLKIIQKEKGYRFSVDPLLLTHFVRITDGDSVIDLGTGSGVMPLILADRTKAENITGVDIQSEMVSMAGRSVDLNKLEEKIQICECDLKNLKDQFETESFDVVLSNPPYIPLKAGRINPQEEKAIARHEVKMELIDVIRGAFFLLKQKGSFYLVYPATRAVDLMVSMRENGLEPKEVTMVHSNENSAAKLMLIRAVKGAKPDLTINKPLYIYNLEGGYTDEAHDILENGKENEV